MIWGYRVGDGRGSTCDGTSHLAQDLRLGIEEGNRRSGNQLAGSTIYGVVDQWLGVGGNPDGDGTGDAARNDTLREGEGDAEWQPANHHLTEETLHTEIISIRAYPLVSRINIHQWFR